MLRSAQERGEAGRRIEAWQAEPIQRSIARDQCRCVCIANEGIVFYLCGAMHEQTPVRHQIEARATTFLRLYKQARG